MHGGCSGSCRRHASSMIGFAPVEVRVAEAPGHAGATFRDDSSGGAAQAASSQRPRPAAPLPGFSRSERHEARSLNQPDPTPARACARRVFPARPQPFRTPRLISPPCTTQTQGSKSLSATVAEQNQPVQPHTQRPRLIQSGQSVSWPIGRILHSCVRTSPRSLSARHRHQKREWQRRRCRIGSHPFR